MTAGINNAISMPMMVITTNNSTSVNPSLHCRFMRLLLCLWIFEASTVATTERWLESPYEFPS
jgi:hypothetical protein